MWLIIIFITYKNLILGVIIEANIFNYYNLNLYNNIIKL